MSKVDINKLLETGVDPEDIDELYDDEQHEARRRRREKDEPQ